jgi:hypothetical protein
MVNLAARPNDCCSWRQQRRTWRRWLQANQHEVARIMARLEGSGVSPERVLAVANARMVELDLAIDLIVDLPMQLAAFNAAEQGDANSRAVDQFAVVARLRAMAVNYAAGIGGPLPQGASGWPPRRPNGFDLSRVDGIRWIQAIEVLETNDYPVSSPSFGRPADPLFNTWFKALEHLGTRELTMAEMNRLILADTQWRFPLGGLRRDDEFRPVPDAPIGLQSVHELHKFFGGFRRLPAELGLTPGYGGEQGLIARATDPYMSVPGARWAEQADLGTWWGKLVVSLRANYELTKDAPVADRVQTLTTHSKERVESQLQSFASLGFLADPRDCDKLRPLINTLLTTPPHSAARANAAQALDLHLRDRERLAESVSVWAATAEIQVLQTIGQYLKNHALDVHDPSHRIDAVEVYRLYRSLLAAGKLTTPATVEKWLADWGVQHVP